MSEQATPEQFEHRVQRLRFKLTGRAISYSSVGADDVLPERTSWGVPLGQVDVEGRPSLAVLTTRCVIDHRYPLLQIDPHFVNFALFSGEPRSTEVFAVAHPPGAEILDEIEIQATII